MDVEPVAVAVTPNGALGFEGPDGSSSPQAASANASRAAAMVEKRESWSMGTEGSSGDCPRVSGKELRPVRQ